MLRFKLVTPLWYFIMLFILAGIVSLFVGGFTGGLFVHVTGFEKQIVWWFVGIVWFVLFLILILSHNPQDAEI